MFLKTNRKYTQHALKTHPTLTQDLGLRQNNGSDIEIEKFVQAINLGSPPSSILQQFPSRHYPTQVKIITELILIYLGILLEVRGSPEKRISFENEKKVYFLHSRPHSRLCIPSHLECWI
jgi:hypothetical protein